MLSHCLAIYQTAALLQVEVLTASKSPSETLTGMLPLQTTCPCAQNYYT
jgi:hypothetical protein